MPTGRKYLEQQAQLARDYLSGQLSLQQAAQRLAHVMQTSLADDRAWRGAAPGKTQAHELHGNLEWFGSLVPEASEPDQARLAELMKEALAEWDKLEGMKGLG
jgi:hypothetical protein